MVGVPVVGVPVVGVLEMTRRWHGGRRRPEAEAAVVPKQRPPPSSEEWTVVPRIESWDNSAGVHSRRNCPFSARPSILSATVHSQRDRPFSKTLVGKPSQESRYPQPSVQNLGQNCGSSPNLWILSAKSEYMMNDRNHVHEQRSSTLARCRLYSVDAKS